MNACPSAPWEDNYTALVGVKKTKKQTVREKRRQDLKKHLKELRKLKKGRNRNYEDDIRTVLEDLEKDRLDAWGEVTEKSSFRERERLTVKKQAGKLLRLHKIRRKQLHIMVEVRRRDIRLQLRAATCISFAMDDKVNKNTFGIDVSPPRRHELEIWPLTILKNIVH